MNDIDVEGQWVYTDGTPVDYVNWDRLQPDGLGDCVFTLKIEGMSVLQCSQECYYICKQARLNEIDIGAASQC